MTTVVRFSPALGDWIGLHLDQGQAPDSLVQALQENRMAPEAARASRYGALHARASESSTPPETRKKTSRIKALPCWPRFLRAVRAWLTPAYWLTRCCAPFAGTAPPAGLAALLGALNICQGINLYLRL